MSLQEGIERDGYVIARNILTGEEIARLRHALIQHFQLSWTVEGLGKHQPNAAVEIAAIRWVFTHPAILATFRELFGQDRLVFTGNCDAHMNMLSWWHKDTSEGAGGCFSGDYFSRSDCRVYRAGIYLQDHDIRHGLTVRNGSHHTKSLTTGLVETLRTHAGDVIFFDIRLTHAGQFADPVENLLLRAGRKLRREVGAAAIKARYQRLMGKADKLSIFFTYGVPGAATDEYCRFEYEAKKGQTNSEARYLPDRLIAELQASDLEYYPAMARM